MATSKAGGRTKPDPRARIPVRWFGEPEEEGPYTTTKRFRSNPELDQAITDAADWLGMSESEVIRAGVRMVDRLVRRQRHGAILLDMADIPGDDTKFEGR